MNGAIELICGGLGGGKTLFAVERIYEHLRKGGWVFTNIEMYPDKVAERLASEGFKFDAARLVLLGGDVSDFHTRISRGSHDSLVMVAIDEAHLSWNSRDWAQTNRDLLNFNTLVRKLDILLLYITQDALNLDKQFRRMIQRTWLCRNLSRLNLFGILPCPIPLLFRVCYDMGRGAGKGQRCFTEVKWRGSWAFGLYKSDALLGAAAEKFAGLTQVHASPLEKITRSTSGFGWEILVCLCAAFFASY